ncbi:MAG: type VI secretion system baseplate subunit TssF [Acidithiobacillales bacterium]
MRSELLDYYERELGFLRQMGAEFAQKYPKIAARLQLEPDKCEDPHVERLLEAFAFLAARVRLKIEDEFPEITESLLGILYPGFLAPIPSLSVVQFVLDAEQVSLQTGQTIPQGSTLSSSPVDGLPCRFRTTYPVTIWPIEAKAVRFEQPPPVTIDGRDARTQLHLELRATGDVALSELKRKVSESEERPLESLRFYLQGEPKVVYSLYELLYNDALAVEFRPSADAPDSAVIRLGPRALRPVGFSDDETLLPPSDRAFRGYRFLQEYFAFPEKFLFLDLTGLERLGGRGFKELLDVRILCSRPFAAEKSVTAQTFRLHATPVVNLFPQLAEPVRVTQLKHEYRVIPNLRRPGAFEVWSVDQVSSTAPDLETTKTYRPFFAFRHDAERAKEETFWHMSRRPSERKDDEGTEIYLSLVDMAFDPSVPETETLNVHVTCSNRDLPARLPFGAPEGDFQLEGPGVFTAIRALVKPTSSLRPPLRRGAHWRLTSHLALNVLSLVEREGAKGPEALREILRLYDFADSSATRQQIAGLSKLSSRRVVRPLRDTHPGFVRGLEVTIELDEQNFVGSGAFLFASVLERFLSLYASVNSFSQLVATTRQREGILRRWPPRSGDQIIL